MKACTWAVSVEKDGLWLDMEHQYTLLNVRPVSEGILSVYIHKINTDQLQLSLLYLCVPRKTAVRVSDR